MKFTIYQTSHQGSRKKNEDRMGYSHTDESILLVVADGMGGHPEGQKAAQLAVDTLGQLFQKSAKPRINDVAVFLESALLTAHREILRYAIDHEMPDSPRTTLVAAVVQDGKIQWIHCGDSRLYFMRNQNIVARTRDHSYSELQDSVMPEKVNNAINRNILFTCLGSPARPIYNLSEAYNLDIHDRILLCSDGLWSAVDDAAIAHHMGSGSLKEQTTTLIQHALLQAGNASDNITVVALDWKECKCLATKAHYGLDDDFLDTQEFTTTVSGELFNDEDIQRNLNEINSTIEKYRKT